MDELENNIYVSIGVVADVEGWNLVSDICRQRLIEKGLINVNGDTFSVSSDLYNGSDFIFSSDLLLELRNLIEEQRKEQNKEYFSVYLPEGGALNNFYNHSCFTNYYCCLSDETTYLSFRDYFKDSSKWCTMATDGTYVYVLDASKYMYIYKDNNGNLKYVDSKLNVVSDSVLSIHSSLNGVKPKLEKGMDFEAFKTCISEMPYSAQGLVLNGVNYRIRGNVGAYGLDLVVFNSLQALYDYVNSKPTAYYTTDYYNKTYQDIVVNRETINNYTTENMQNIYNTVNNNVQDALTQEELQKVIDDTVSKELEKINSSLGNVNDNLDDVIKNLKIMTDNLKAISTETKTANNWLEKIYNRLGDIYTLLVDGYLYESGQETDELFNSYMSADNYAEMITIFLYGITTEQQKQTLNVVAYYDDLSSGVTDDSDIYNISGYSYDFYTVNGSSYSHGSSPAIRAQYGGIVGHISHKFPFCIPFDIYDMVSLFVDEPETPSFVIPFHVEQLNFDYDIVVDLSGFDMLSRFTRSLTTIIMVFGIVVFTKKNITG